MKLSELSIGSTATILAVGGSGALRQHFLDMGLIQGTEVTVVKYAPMGDPIELRIHGYELTIRLEDAGNIEISQPHKPKSVEKKKSGKTPPRLWRGRKISQPERRKASSGRRNSDLCPGRKPELRKNYTL